MRTYFHLYSDGKTIKQISRDEWFKILMQRHKQNTKLVATVYKGEISLDKGENHIFILRGQLEKILDRV